MQLQKLIQHPCGRVGPKIVVLEPSAIIGVISMISSFLQMDLRLIFQGKLERIFFNKFLTVVA